MHDYVEITLPWAKGTPPKHPVSNLMRARFTLFRLLLCLPCLAAGVRLAGAKSPNILFILTDDQRWDAMSIAGNKHLKTPNMDRIGSGMKASILGTRFAPHRFARQAGPAS